MEQLWSQFPWLIYWFLFYPNLAFSPSKKFYKMVLDIGKSIKRNVITFSASINGHSKTRGKQGPKILVDFFF